MIIGDRLRQLREAKNLSQGHIEQKTGLLRCYISRVENGHTVPAIETLEKLARAMEVPLYQLFYDGENAKPLKLKTEPAVKLDRKTATALRKLNVSFPKLGKRDRQLLVSLSHHMLRAA